MNKIIITDEFLDTKEYEKLLFLLKDFKMDYGIKSNTNEIYVYNERFFSFFFETPFFIKYILQKIEKKYNKKLEIKPSSTNLQYRNYIQNQTYGKNGEYHIDSREENTYTFCLYIHNIDKLFKNLLNKNHNHILNPEEIVEHTGGEFFIKIPDRKEIICIEPVSNRGIFFPSGYKHNGSGFNRFYPNYRYCLVWQLREIFDCKRCGVADVSDPRNSEVADERVCRRGGVSDVADARNSGVADERV